MKICKLIEFKNGWFVGNFEPSLINTNDVEVAVKMYNKGDFEKRHYHKIATELTVIIIGKVKMNGEIYEAGDIVIIEPMESVDFEVLDQPTICSVVKYPGVNNDKYIGEYYD